MKILDSEYNWDGKTKFSANFDGKLSFILSFLFPEFISAATYIFTAPTCTTTIVTLEPCALNAEFQHFLLRFNKNFLTLRISLKEGTKGETRPKDRVALLINLGQGGGADTLKFNLHVIGREKKGCEFNQKRCEFKILLNLLSYTCVLWFKYRKPCQTM
jgi:hypothetical protein